MPEDQPLLPGGSLNGTTNGNTRYGTSRNNHRIGIPHLNGHHTLDNAPRGGRDFILNVYKKSKIVLLSNYVNILLVFVPLGMLSGFLGWNPTATFVLNFLAIIPLAALLSFATEELSLMVGQTIGGLLNATFGNAVELIVRILRGMHI